MGRRQRKMSNRKAKEKSFYLGLNRECVHLAT
jgi:hypothetical protein